MGLSDNLTDWMGDVNREAIKRGIKEVRINDLCIPGTHDSGTAFVKTKIEKIVNAVRCQEKDIAEQLNLGIRYLDIRVKYSEESDEFYIVHDGPFDAADCDCCMGDGSRLTLPLVMGICAGFLAAHPGECIIMSMKMAKSTREYGPALAEYLTAAYGNLLLGSEAPRTIEGWFEYLEYPKLQDAAGKIILLRRFDADQQLGYDYTGWGSVGADSEGCFYLPSSSPNLNYYALIQDMFSFGVTTGVDVIVKEKVGYYTNTLKKYQSECGDMLKYSPMLLINFLSCTQLHSIHILADNINSYVEKNCTDRALSGVTVMDFLSERLTKVIIDGNRYLFQKESM